MIKTQTLCFGIFLALFFSCQSDKDKGLASDQQLEAGKTLSVDSKGLSKATMTLKTVHGNIVLKLYPKQAPITVARIIELANEKFYDGLSFHRVVPGFVVQGGDPKGDGTGGSGKKLKAEFSDLQHVKGTVAMARAQDKNSADSQFYIALNTLSHLDGQYTIFGQVTKGIDLLEKIEQGDKIISLSFNSEGSH